MLAPNGTKSEYSYDSLQRLTGVANKTSTNAILSQYGYTIDNTKSIRTAMSEVQGANPQRTVSYTYDTINQLTVEAQSEATLPDASTRSQTLTYDAMGNRTARTLAQSVNGGTSSTTSVLSTHNGSNQLTAQSASVNGVPLTGTSFAYDASGNMTAQTQNNGGGTYVYDDADRLTQIVQKDAGTGAFTKKSEFVYDGEDRKVISREYSWVSGAWALQSETRRVYDGMDVVQERDASNVTKVNYTRSGNIGGLLARSDANGSVFYSYDGSGNVVGLTNASQQVVAEYAYDGWGNTLRATGAMASVNAYRYSTKELQASSGLYDYGYRFYSPGLGRWVNRDPIEEDGGLNLYGAFLNDPSNSWDEYGLMGRGNRKGERDRTGKRAGTPSPNKGLRELNPPDPKRVFDPKARNGRGQSIARPPDMEMPWDGKNRRGPKSPPDRRGPNSPKDGGDRKGGGDRRGRGGRSGGRSGGGVLGGLGALGGALAGGLFCPFPFFYDPGPMSYDPKTGRFGPVPGARA